MARIKDTCLTGQHFSPLWNLDLRVYIQELDVERSLCVGGRGYKEGKTEGRGKTDRHCMLSFMWNPNYHVYMWRRKGREGNGVNMSRMQWDAWRCQRWPRLCIVTSSNPTRAHGWVSAQLRMRMLTHQQGAPKEGCPRLLLEIWKLFLRSTWQEMVQSLCFHG